MSSVGGLDRLKDIDPSTVGTMKQQGLTRDMATEWRVIPNS